MNSLLHAELEAKRTALIVQYEKFCVAQLDEFGSGASADWQPGESNLDLSSHSASTGPGARRRYVALAEELEGAVPPPGEDRYLELDTLVQHQRGVMAMLLTEAQALFETR